MKHKTFEMKKNQFLLGTISPHNAIYTQTIHQWLLCVLTLIIIDTSTFTDHSTRAASTFKARVLGVPTKETLKRGYWSRNSTFQKYYCHEIIDNCKIVFEQGVLLEVRQFCRK